MRGIASSIEYGRSWTCAAAAVNFLPCFAMCLLVVLSDAFGVLPLKLPTTNFQLPTPKVARLRTPIWELEVGNGELSAPLIRLHLFPSIARSPSPSEWRPGDLCNSSR